MSCDVGQIQNSFPQDSDCVHIDTGPARSNVDRAADILGIAQRLRYALDKRFVGTRHSLLHKCGKTADKIDADLGRRFVQSLGNSRKIRVIAGGGTDRHRGYGDPLIHNGNAEFFLDLLPRLHKVFRFSCNLVIDLLPER